MKFGHMIIIAAFPVLAIAAQKEDQTVLVQAEDQEMNDAIAKARSTLDNFLELKANPPVGASGFKIKVRIQDSHGTEHMWVTPFKRTEQGFKGILADVPEYVTSVKIGQVIHFTRQDVSDWGYVLDGKQKGSYTVCVAFNHMPSSEVERYRRDYGFECY